MNMNSGFESGSLLGEPSFAGRERELEILRQELQLAGTGRPRLIFLEVPSGGGKTRLLKEFILRNSGKAMFLQGQGIYLGAQRPLQLLTGPLDQLAMAGSDDEAFRNHVREKTEIWRGVLCAGFPQLKVFYKDSPPAEPGRDALNIEHILKALASLTDSIGTSSAPAVLILDDAQWGDEMAIRLLSIWQRLRNRDQEAGAHLMIIVSFRADEVGPSHLLRELSPDNRISFSGLPDPELREALSSMAGSIPEEAIDLVMHLSGGSPFMAVTVMRGFAELGILKRSGDSWFITDSPVPQDMASSSLADRFIVRRFELLSDEARRLLETAAVMGKEFSSPMTLMISGCGEGALEEALHRHIIEHSPAQGRCIFLHDKLREAVLQTIPPERRRQLCLEIASAFEEQGGGSIFDLAFFYSSAEEYGRALPYALKAAEEARVRASLQMAEQQYRIALMGLGGDDRKLSFSIMTGLGEVLMLRGQYEEALGLFSRARGEASDGIEEASVEARICETIFKQGDTGQARAALHKGLARLGVRVPPCEAEAFLRAPWEILVQLIHNLFPGLFLGKKSLEGADRDLIICRLLNQLGYVNWMDRAGIFSLFWSNFKALNLIERYPPTMERAHTYSSHGPGMTIIGCYSRGFRYSGMALQIARELKNVWGEGQALNFLGIAHLPAADYAECIDNCFEASRLLEQAGDLWELNMARCNVTYALYRSGNVREAAAWAKRCFQESFDAQDLMTSASSLSVWAKSSFGEISIDDINRLRPLIPASSYQPLAEVGQAEAIYLAAREQPGKAVEILEKHWDTVFRKGVPQEYVVAVLPWLVTMHRLSLEQGAAEPGRGKSLRLLGRARKLAQTALLISRVFKNNMPHALRELALLNLIQGRKGEAMKCIEKSLAHAAGIKARLEYAQSLFAKGRIEAASGLDTCGKTLEKAAEILNELGALQGFERIERSAAGKTDR